MGLLIYVIALVILDVLALRFGYDSREMAQSKEQELARFGVKWTDPIKVRRAGLVRRARRRVARKLYDAAEWLSPGSLGLNGTPT
jgi:hypothetical protein